MFGWITMGSGATTAEVVHPQWVYRRQVRDTRSFPPRIRGDVLMLPGDFRSTDPAVDTWEGEAT